MKTRKTPFFLLFTLLLALMGAGVALALLYAVYPEETVQVGEAVGKAVSAVREEALSVSEALILGKPLEEATSLAEAISKSVSKAIAELAGIVEQAVKGVSKSFTDATSIAESLVFTRPLLEGVGAVEEVVKGVAKLLAEPVATGELLTYSYAKPPEAVSLSEALGFGKPLVESMGVSESYSMIGPAHTLEVVSVSPPEIIADGATESTITFKLLDQFGNPLPDKPIVFSTDCGTVYPTEACTNASGCVSVTLKSEPWKVATANVTARTKVGTLVEGVARVKFTTDTYSISLTAGWNLISLPLMPYNASIEAVLSDVIDKVEVVWHYDASSGRWLVYTPGPAPDTLTEMRDGRGYFVKMKEPGTLIVRGFVAPAPPTPPPTYSVVKGWNLIGFKSKEPVLVKDYLRALEGKWASLWTYPWQRLYEGNYMVPGRGYWLYATEAGEIVP